MAENVTQRMAEHAQDQGWSDRIAFLIDDQSWTFAQVFDDAARVAGGYQAAGLREGERVLLALPDSIEMVWCLLGAWQAGLVAVPANVHMSKIDLTRDVTTAEPALAVVDQETAGWLDTAGLVPTTGVEPLLAGSPDPSFAGGDDTPALAVFTSGTTGAPKLCFFRHRNLCQSTHSSHLADNTGSVGFSLSRMYFYAGLSASLFTTLEAGQTTVLSRPRATPPTAIELMRRHHVTTLFSQPSFLAKILLYPDHAAVLEQLRQATCGGEVLTERLREQLVPILGARLVNSYGATEIGEISFGTPALYDASSAVGPAFNALPTRIIDPDGYELPAGNQGELYVHVPFATLGVDRGSLGPQHLTDTWWPTGDLASIDENNVIHVHGRLDDVEVVGGQNMIPDEVERLLENHPHVVEAAVSVTRLPAGDTRLRAYVVAAPESGTEQQESAKKALAAELVELVRSRLSWYKIPHDVVWLSALPRNGDGKVLRNLLREHGDQFV